MKKPLLILLALCPFLLPAQITLVQWDLPSRGETYIQAIQSDIPAAMLPSNIWDSTGTEESWDFSSFNYPLEYDTFTYTWTEGTPAALDFPDANMVTIDTAEGDGYAYFTKNVNGFWFSGQSSAFDSPMGGEVDLNMEFRPAIPIIETPATLGDEVIETSRAKMDLFTFGEVRVKVQTNYSIDAYGMLKLPGGEEEEVLKINRKSNSEVITEFEIFGEKQIDTTYEESTTIEFYASGYGDVLLSIDTFYNFRTGGMEAEISYRESVSYSSLDDPATINMVMYPNPATDQLSIDLSAGLEGQLSIVDLSGREVYNTSFNKNHLELNIASLKRGAYLLRITSGDRHLSKQFYKM